MSKQLKQSLFGSGFKRCGKCYIHYKTGIAISNLDPLEISVGGIDPTEIAEFIQTVNISSSFGHQLIEWVETKQKEDTEEAPGFIQDSDENIGRLDVKYLHNLVSGDPNRQLTIYTWGKRFKKRKPEESQKNFNASVLNGRAPGINLKTMNGTYDELQYVVSRCSTFDSWITMCVQKIEEDNLHTISINCAKGRHRSVAAAEILKKVYYPSAKISHLTISK